MPDLMVLRLVKLADAEVTGIYGEGKKHLPERMRYLSPEAAQSYRNIRHIVIVSDMFRSAESSLVAKRDRRGAQAPSFSGHNYGFSIDIDVDKMLRELRLTTKVELDAWMASHGWYCHRRDGRRGFEEWHYNYFLPVEFRRYVKDSDQRTSAGLERMIQATYGPYWADLNPFDIQHRLKALKMYSGDVDGKIGPLSKEAIRVFQRAWDIRPVSQTINVATARTLALVSATVQLF